MALQKRTDGKDEQPAVSTVAVLEEDEYRASIDHIIRRDFFPDLQRLEAENQGCLIEQSDGDAADFKPEQSLDAFLQTHTSEDNASFSRLLLSENSRRQAARHKASSTHRRIAHSGRNALMCGPDGIAPRNPRGRGKIVHSNTRLGGDIEDMDDAASEISETTTAGYATPTINGFRMVDTPERRGFSIAPRSRREQAGLRLGGQTPDRRAGRDASWLSPAGLRLLGRSQRGSRGDDLRSVYNSPYVRRPS
ncbi:hypothetical protein H4S02_001813 [Coemansia sp. RSA 2611]|nr:hypothetical protein H4S01_000689 [Coemansia sp. RSA 2610]KAJ2390525.1 hypothetical protein H4S02_001813 [Coemansia sp. RSA 2611]